MSGLSVAVAGLGLRTSGPSGHQALSVAPSGIVADSTPTRPSPSHALTASPSAKATRAPRTPVRPRRTTAPRVPVPTTTRPRPRPSPTPRPTPTSITVNGAPADTQYGPVQVQITLTNGRIVRADAIDYPQGSSRDQAINSQAIPQLDQETLQAQSAQIDTVSGATYTSDGYRQSLQSALDAAHAR